MPRTSLSYSKVSNAVRYSRYYLDGALYQTDSDVPAVLSVQKSRSTVNTPNYRTLKKRMEGLPFNNFSYSETSIAYPYGTMSQQWDYPKFRNMWHVTGSLVFVDFHDEDPISDSLIASTDAAALQKSLSDLKGMKVNLGVAFGERKRTSDLILGTAQRIGDSLRALKNGNVGAVASALGLTTSQVKSSLQKSGSPNYTGKRSSRTNVTRVLAREWLALQYGWKPLLSDVYKAAERLAMLSDERRVRLTSSKTVYGYKSDKRQWNKVDATRVAQSRYTRKYIYVFSHSNEVLKDLSGLGVTNPASVAWELLPWSFVIDWFIPLGNYIDVWDATLGLTFEKGCTTTFRKYRAQFKANGTKQVSSTFYQCHGSGSIEKVNVTRTVLNSFPSPHLPNFAPHITFNRGVSTLALLRQRLKL